MDLNLVIFISGAQFNYSALCLEPRMNELYLANRNLSELYRQKLREKIFILDQSKMFSGQTEINPRVYYLDFIYWGQIYLIIY